MANWLPGAGDLGRCVDIFGSYDPSSSGRVLFDFKQSPQSWSWNGQAYDLPDNIGIPQDISAGTAQVQTFTSKSEYAESLAVKANVKGSYGGFSGEASAAYKNSTTGSTQTTLTVVTMDYESYKITLQHPTANRFSASVLHDPDYANLPSKFDPKNPADIQLFVRFFSKYGTHFIDSITCGAQLQLFAFASTSAFSSNTAVKASVKASYDGLFSAQGSASANWSQVSKSDFSNLNIRIAVKGGTTSILNTVTASYGANYYAEIQNWLTTVNTQPVPRDFTVKRVSDLLSGAKAQALQDATDYFDSKRLSVSTDPSAGQASVSLPTWSETSGGPFTQVVPGATLTLGGMFIVIIDRTTLERKFVQTYDISVGRALYTAYNNGPAEASKNFDPILNNDLKPYVYDPNVIIVIAFPNCSTLYSYPSVKFTAFLRQLAPGQGGIANIDKLAGHETSGSMTHFAYTLIGVPQHPDMGFDIIQLDPLNWGLHPPKIDLAALLLPEYNSQSVQYVPFAG